MCSGKSFVIERKSFVVSFSKDVVEIVEKKSKALEVSVGLEEHIAKWLIKKMNGIMKAS